MSSPIPPLPDRAEAAATLLAWGRRLLRRPNSDGVPKSGPSGGDSLPEVGRRLRAAREERGLSLRELALETRISITVLEALEKGWRDRLPEPTYLRTMLTLLEQHLGLESFSLEAALPPRVVQAGRHGPDPSLQRISLGSIELFSTWQGSVVYAVLCLLLIYGLNRQQQHLAARGLFALRPIPAQLSSPGARASAADRDRARVLAAYPDIRPLERARQGQALQQLQQEARPAADGKAPSTGATPSATTAPATAPGQSATTTPGSAAAPKAGAPAPQAPAAGSPRP